MKGGIGKDREGEEKHSMRKGVEGRGSCMSSSFPSAIRSFCYMQGKGDREGREG